MNPKNITMITLTITNNYYQNLTAHPGDVTIKAIDQKVINKVSNLYVEIPGLWNLNILDLGENHIPDYPKPDELYGMLIRTPQGAAYYRYNDVGNITIAVDNFGSIVLSSTSGTLFTVGMPALSVDFSA